MSENIKNNQCAKATADVTQSYFKIIIYLFGLSLKAGLIEKAF